MEKRLHRLAGPIFEVSALKRLEGRSPEREWSRLMVVLERLTHDSGFRLIRKACDRSVERLSEQLLVIVAEGREALCRPISDSEERVAMIRNAIASAVRSMSELGFLFTAEQQYLSNLLVGRRKGFVNLEINSARTE